MTHDTVDREDDFLVVLDGMIESTQEFIADDNDPEGRLADLKALEHVRRLFEEAFRVQ